MFDLNAILKTASLTSDVTDLVSDLVGKKERQVRKIKFFRYKEGNLGIAFFDSQTVHGEYWIENIPVPAEYEPVFEASGFDIGTKYDVVLLGLQPFSADKKVLRTSAIQKRLLSVIFEAIA